MEKEDIEEKGGIERQVKLWCRVRGYHYEDYEKLSDVDKNTLHKIICGPQQITSDNQRKKLIEHMFFATNLGKGREFDDPIDSIPVEKQGILLSPLTPEEITHHFARY